VDGDGGQAGSVPSRPTEALGQVLATLDVELAGAGQREVLPDEHALFVAGLVHLGESTCA